MGPYLPFPADGHAVAWEEDGGDELTTITWENEGWTVSGLVSRARVQYVLRLTAQWQLSQFLLFRDLDEPDLWLGTDGAGRWGEVNGAHRPELDGCYDLDLACTPFTQTLPVRRLGLDVGEQAHLGVVHVDPETLAVRRVERRYTRLGSHRWRDESIAEATAVEFDVDDHGVPVDHPPGWRRRPS